MTGIRHRLLATMGLIGALALGGCAYDDGYGYGGVNVGTGYYGGGGYYGDGYYGQTGYYQPGAFGGWYNNYYYPGNGYYVYDRGGRRHRWNDGQRRYWEGRRAERGDNRWRDRDRDGRPDGRPDWRGRDNDGRGDARGEWRGRGNDGRPGDDRYTRPQPQPGVEGDRGRGRWQGNNAVRPTPQGRADRPQASQARPQRDWSAQRSQGVRSERAVRSRAPGASRQERPD